MVHGPVPLMLAIEDEQPATVVNPGVLEVVFGAVQPAGMTRVRYEPVLNAQLPAVQLKPPPWLAVKAKMRTSPVDPAEVEVGETVIDPSPLTAIAEAGWLRMKGAKVASMRIGRKIRTKRFIVRHPSLRGG
jgi:hypothetical protein